MSMPIVAVALAMIVTAAALAQENKPLIVRVP